ncbi:metal-sensitive transcriptional regulator [Microbacterium sp. LMC-P-041]|uniref:metal-sensitive transcriptional regulator n=1 Tax=Microbacterium sp. LMC-P-041 TaxID=3040293 RepID=UPI00255727AF|nr:metal-sensitive transcriptional regulator [Microbacterium sp. LMC-P-041]
MDSTNHEAQRRVLNRLRRARGQLDAVITAVEAEASCRDVVTQLAAVTHALNRAGFVVVAAALEECIGRSGDAEGPTVEELEKVFLSLA